MVNYDGIPTLSFSDNESVCEFLDSFTSNGYEYAADYVQSLGVRSYYGLTDKVNRMIDSVAAISHSEIVADMPHKPAPMLHPHTQKPVTVDDLSAIFHRELSRQELNTTDRYIEIP